MGQHVQDLDRNGRRGIWLKYYDPDAERFPVPTYPFHGAPKGLVTRRQLRDAGLAPGHEPVAHLRWVHTGAKGTNGERWARLYDKALAVPKRIATPAVRAAVDRALTARKTCPSCHEVRDYYIPRRQGECNSCADRAHGVKREPEPEFTGDPSLSWFEAQEQQQPERTAPEMNDEQTERQVEHELDQRAFDPEYDHPPPEAERQAHLASHQWWQQRQQDTAGRVAQERLHAAAAQAVGEHQARRTAAYQMRAVRDGGVEPLANARSMVHQGYRDAVLRGYSGATRVQEADQWTSTAEPSRTLAVRAGQELQQRQPQMGAC